MSTFKTDQEAFWASEFGTEYIDRNKGKEFLASNLNFFAKALHGTSGIKSILEFGANIGMNVDALSLLLPNTNCSGVEINSDAAKILERKPSCKEVFNTSIFDFSTDQKFDLTLIKGVLIHINPDMLHNVYEKLYQYSSKYILIAEYYNPTPVSIPYRGHDDRLFKRDFAGEFLEKFPDTKLLDYGFAYRNDPKFPQDDVTWFLIEK